MDKAEYHRILEEMTESVQKKEYRHAMELADQVDWKRVKSIRTLNTVADIYERNREYERELNVLKIAYSRSSIGRGILYRLTEVSLKLNDLNAAERYFQEFSKVAQNDNSRCILQYKLYRAKNAPLDAQIAVLEEYREREYTEKWAFELARLYARAGEVRKCVDACDDLILWFSEGTYVRKAMELKMEYEPLTTSQRAMYDRMRIQSMRPEKDGEESSTEEKPVSYTQPAEYTVEKEVSLDATKVISPEETPGESPAEQSVPNPVPEEASREPEEEKASSEEEVISPDMEEIEESEDTPSAEEATSEVFEDAEEEPAQEEEPEQEPEAERGFGDEEEEEDELSASSGSRFRAGAEDFKNRLVHGIRDVFGGFTEKPDEEGGIEPERENTESGEEPEEETAPLHVIKDLEPEHQTTDIDIDSISREMKTSYGDEPEEFDLETAIEKNTESAIHAEEKHKEEQQEQSVQTPVRPVTKTLAAPEKAQTVPEPEQKEEPTAAQTEEPAAPEKAQTVPETGQKEEPLAAQTEEPAAPREEQTNPAEEKEDLFGSTGPIDLEEKPKQAVGGEAGKEERPITPDSGTERAGEEKKPETADSSAAPAPETDKPSEKLPDPAEQLTRAIQNTVFDHVPAAEQPKRTPHYIEGLEVPDPEPTAEERKSRTITLSEVGENTVPISLDQILSEETPEERRIRILNKARPTRMSEEQRKVFTYFARLPGMDTQILEALNGVYTHAGERTSLHGNIAVMGAAGSGKSRLSRGLVLTMCQDMGLEAAKVARINGADMNKKDPVAVVSKMSGGFLIIEDVSLMTADTLAKLNQAMEFRTDCMILIIEDEKTNMRAYLKKNPSFAAKFEKVINIPVFTNDELVTFARTYAAENDCRMDDMGVLALYTLIGNNQKENEPMTVAKVKEIMDDAIHRATRGKKRSRRSSAKDKILILHEKDFEQ